MSEAAHANKLLQIVLISKATNTILAYLNTNLQANRVHFARQMHFPVLPFDVLGIIAQPPLLLPPCYIFGLNLIFWSLVGVPLTLHSCTDNMKESQAQARTCYAKISLINLIPAIFRLAIFQEQSYHSQALILALPTPCEMVIWCLERH